MNTPTLDPGACRAERLIEERTAELRRLAGKMDELCARVESERRDLRPDEAAEFDQAEAKVKELRVEIDERRYVRVAHAPRSVHDWPLHGLAVRPVRGADAAVSVARVADRARLTELPAAMVRRAATLPFEDPERQRLIELAWGIRRNLARTTPNLPAVRALLDEAATREAPEPA